MLAMAFAAPAHAAKPDIAAEWRDFLAKAKADEVYPAFSIVVDLIDGQGDISEAACRENADAIAQAVRVVPVSAAVNFAAYRCAELLGDDAAAEKHGARYAAIASHAREPVPGYCRSGSGGSAKPAGCAGRGRGRLVRRIFQRRRGDHCYKFTQIFT